MSRSIATTGSVLRSAVASSTASARHAPLQARLRVGACSAALHTSSPRRAASKVNTISVDPRIMDGTAGFLPKENVDRLVEWQSGLWERLAAEVNNNPGLASVKQKWNSSGLDMTHLLHFTARDPSLTLAFNYASALINNSYFLESINPSDEQSVPSFVEPNLQALREKTEAYAEGIMGGGWIWLVRSGVSHSDLDIIPTFGAGTLLITQRAQLGREDVPLFGTPSSTDHTSSPSSNTSSVGSEQENDAAQHRPLNEIATGPVSKQRSPNGRDSRAPLLPIPLAVLNLHEMAWLGSKYGVWDKSRYAADWFKSLDWSRVASRAR